MTKYRPPYRMKLKPFATRLFSALAGALLVCSNQSEAALSYNDGDLLLSFRATGGTGTAVDYIVNLGSASTFTSLSAGSVLTLDTEIGNLLADLNVQYGSWQTRVDFLWSVSGVQKSAGSGFANNTIFATRTHNSNSTLGFQDSTAWTSPTSFGAGAPAGKVQVMSQAFALGNSGGPGTATESTNVPLGLIQGVGNTNSYRSMMPGGSNVAGGSTAFGVFDGGIEGNFGNGTSGVVLDLYTMVPNSGTGAFEGTFSIDNNATVTFTAAIPEPSSFAALGGGLAALAGIRRRRFAK